MKAALAACSLFILCCAPAQYLGRQEDDILFVIASHALSQGSYRLFTSPGAPPLSMAAPGLPVLLLPATWLAGERFAVYQFFFALLLAAVPWLLWFWLKRRADDLTALLICLLFGLSPIVLSQAGTVMSEVPYLFFFCLLLLVLDRPKSGPKAAGLLLALTQLRPAGLSLLPAVLARPLREKRWKDAALMAALPGLGALAWSLWSFSASGSVQEIKELSLSYQAHPAQHLLAVAADNMKFFLASWGASYLPARWGAGPAALGLGATLGALSFWGGCRLLRKDPNAEAPLMLAAALFMHSVWAWQYERYLIPLLPWLLWTCAEALGKKSRPVLAALLAAQVCFQSRLWLGQTSWSKPELTETYRWLKAQGTSADILSSLLYVRDGFYTARPSLPLPDSARPEEFAGALKKRKIRLVLWQDRLDAGLSAKKTSAVQNSIDRAGRYLDDSRRYRLIYENPNENSRVYQPR